MSIKTLGSGIRWGEVKYETIWRACLYSYTIGRPIPFGDSAKDIERILASTDSLNYIQQNDFLGLVEQGYAEFPIPEGIGLGGLWTYLFTLSPQEFHEYYIAISQKREVAKGVNEIL